MFHGEERNARKRKRGKREKEKPPPGPGARLAGKPPFAGGFTRLHGAADGAEKEPAAAPPRKNSRELKTEKGLISVANYCPADRLQELNVDDGIRMFSRNNPDRQKAALVKVAGLDGGNVIAGISEDMLISYVGIHHPSERERWGKPGYEWLYELGAIEVSRGFRQLGLAEEMLEVAFGDPFYDDKIVLTTAFTWHWDLEATGMDKLQYRQMFLHLAEMYGFIEMVTDEPNVSMDAANIFLVRIGKKASLSRYQRFSALLYINEWEAMLRGY